MPTEYLHFAIHGVDLPAEVLQGLDAHYLGGIFDGFIPA